MGCHDVDDDIDVNVVNVVDDVDHVDDINDDGDNFEDFGNNDDNVSDINTSYISPKRSILWVDCTSRHKIRTRDRTADSEARTIPRCSAVPHNNADKDYCDNIGNDYTSTAEFDFRQLEPILSCPCLSSRWCKSGRELVTDDGNDVINYFKADFFNEQTDSSQKHFFLDTRVAVIEANFGS